MNIQPIITYLSLGSNLEFDGMSSTKIIIEAFAEISKYAIINKKSSFYNSPAWPEGNDSPDYINVVIEIESILSPMELLGALWSVETDFGRKRSKKDRWAPRTLDIDIISYGDVVMEGDLLELPHPRFEQRDFILVPLNESPDWVNPKTNKTISEILDAYLDSGNTISAKPV